MTPHLLKTLIVIVVLGLSVGGFSAVSPSASAQNLFADLLTGVEVMIGQSVANDVYEQYGRPVRLVPSQQAWIDAIFSDLTAQAGRNKELNYSLEILDTEIVNAFAAPGGFIFVTTGLLQHIAGDTDALANVLGHEIAHVEHRHGMNTLLRRFGIGMLLQLILGGNNENNQVWQTVAGVATELLHLGWSREQEYESDDLGQRLAAAAGYDPYGMVRFFELLLELQGEEIPFLEFLSTHPLTSERADRARARARNLTVAPKAGTSPRVIER